jgi:hypothetical protein
MVQAPEHKLQLLTPLFIQVSAKTCCNASQDQEAAPMPPPAHPPPQFGAWERSDTADYWYNKHLRWYFDVKTGFYYGGEPPAWTQDPGIPDAARFEKMNKVGGALQRVQFPPQTLPLCDASSPSMVTLMVPCS